MAKNNEESDLFQKYGVPIYGAAWIPTKNLLSSSDEDEDHKEKEEDNKPSNSSSWIVFCGGGGEGSSGIPNCLSLIQFDPASNSLSPNLVLLIGGSTSTMLEALHVVGDANDGPLGESFEGNTGYIAPSYDEGASSGSRLKMRLKEFQNSAASFTALDRNYLTPFFTSQNGDDDDDFDERPPQNPRGGRGFRAVRG